MDDGGVSRLMSRAAADSGRGPWHAGGLTLLND